MILNFHVLFIKAYDLFPGRDIKKKNDEIVRLFIVHRFYDNYH